VIDRLNALEAQLFAQIADMHADLDKLRAGLASGIESELEAMGINTPQGMPLPHLRAVRELLPWVMASAVASAALTWAVVTIAQR
jgi:hypothetical protein